jgi:carbamoyl-phosphate synthase large subunit
VYENNKISKIMENLANNINLYGSLNIQFKKKGNKIKVFDINTRLSSTVLFRDLMGFKDLVWWIKDKLKRAYSPKFNIKNVKNQTIVKIFEDKII